MKLFAVILLVAISAPTFAAEGGAHGGGGHGSGEEGGSKKPLPPPAIPAPENINTFIHLKVNNLKKAEPPRVEDRKLILTWKSDSPPRYVAAAFKHEAYREKHLFWRNQNGVYFLVMDLSTEMPQNLEYRLIVDGLWQPDPTNPARAIDEQGVLLNQVALRSADLPRHAGPTQLDFGEVEFSYRGKPGLMVSIVGNFNQWDPFAHFLEEISPGEYRVKIALPEETLLYRFVIGTKSFLDPGNAHTGHDDQGGTFSYFENRILKPETILEAKLPIAQRRE